MDKLLGALVCVAMICTSTAVLAADGTVEPTISTGLPWFDGLIQIVGAVYIICSVLAALLPSEWTATKVLARIAGDIRGILNPPRKD
jgi:Na+/H+ antiporter NhaC